MKYIVHLTEHTYGLVEVEANSEREAKEKAYQASIDGDVHWCDSELKVFDLILEQEDKENTRYYICGIGYDEHDHITDCEKYFGDFDTYAEAYEKFVQLQCKDAAWFFEDTPNLYQLLIQLEECEETDEESNCIDVQNEWWIENPNF